MNMRDCRSPLERMMYWGALFHALDHRAKSGGEAFAALPAPDRNLQLGIVANPPFLVRKDRNRVVIEGDLVNGVGHVSRSRVGVGLALPLSS